MPSKDSLVVTEPATDSFNVTVYGAIGKFMRKPCFLVANTTCKEHMVTFLHLLRESMADECTKIRLVMDNHRSHHSKVAKAAFRSLNISPFYLPPYSSKYNPIETLWSSLKVQYRKNVYQYGQNLTRKRMVKLVEKLLDRYDKEHLDRYITSAYGDIAKTLDIFPQPQEDGL